MKISHLLLTLATLLLASSVPAMAQQHTQSDGKVVTVGQDDLDDDQYAAAATIKMRTDNLLKHQEQEIVANAMLSYAKNYIGRPYRIGSTGPKSFDCSGFTSYVFHQFGYDLLRTSSSQYTQGETISIDDAHPGDLIFFSGRKVSKNVGHVGIITDVNPITGAISFIHASTSRGVRIDTLNDAYFSRRYIGIKRILSPEDIGSL